MAKKTVLHENNQHLVIHRINKLGERFSCLSLEYSYPRAILSNRVVGHVLGEENESDKTYHKTIKASVVDSGVQLTLGKKKLVIEYGSTLYIKPNRIELKSTSSKGEPSDVVIKPDSK